MDEADDADDQRRVYASQIQDLTYEPAFLLARWLDTG